MSIYEASFKTVDPITGEAKTDRLLTMRARNAAQVQAHIETLGLTQGNTGELIVYRY